MPLMIAFEVGAPCAGDGHFTVTVDPTPGAPVVLTRDKSVYRRALDAEERMRFAEYLIRLLVQQLAGSSAAAIKTAIEAKIVDLTVVG
jgi:hypothetical protein